MSGWHARSHDHRAEKARRREAAAAAHRDAAAVLSGTPIPGVDDQVGARRRGRRALPVVVALELGVVTRAAWASQMREALLAALHSLSNNRLRSLLTTIGIVVGVAAVIVLVALGNGMKSNFNAQFSRLANQITITPAKGAVPDGGAPRNLTDQDVTALQDPRRAPDIAAVSPAMVGTVTLTAGQAKDKAALVGATGNYLEMVNRHVVAGQWFTGPQITGGTRGVVLGQTALHLLWGPGADAAQVIDTPIRLSHSTFKITGVLEDDGQDDNVVIVPFGAARTYLVGNSGGAVDQIIVKSTSVDTVEQAATQATDVLDAQHLIHSPTNRDFNIRTFTELLKQSTQFINFLTMFIVAVAAISLLVGGVGVANIMLVSVTERTREIGIRKAVGAPRRAILRQFLSEAVMLTGLGGLIGVTLGIAITIGAATLLPKLAPSIPVPILTITPIAIAFAVSLVIGVLAGGYPANRAARLRPIEALRFE